jgi:hypothetical protein
VKNFLYPGPPKKYFEGGAVINIYIREPDAGGGTIYYTTLIPLCYVAQDVFCDIVATMAQLSRFLLHQYFAYQL